MEQVMEHQAQERIAHTSAEPQSSERTISGVKVEISYIGTVEQPVSNKEISAYIARAHDLYPMDTLEWLKLEVEGEEVGISYGLAPIPFDRIRRITGYLVGNMGRWNNAKSIEEHDRIKHGVDQPRMAIACS